jgi:hypothetical protein
MWIVSTLQGDLGDLKSDGRQRLLSLYNLWLWDEDKVFVF